MEKLNRLEAQLKDKSSDKCERTHQNATQQGKEKKNMNRNWDIEDRLSESNTSNSSRIAQGDQLGALWPPRGVG